MRLNALPGYGERIERARKALGFEARAPFCRELAKGLGSFTEGAVARWELGVNPPDYTTAICLEYLMGIPLAWVERGEGPMLIGPVRSKLMGQLSNESGRSAEPLVIFADRRSDLLPCPSGVGMGPEYGPEAALVLAVSEEAPTRGRIYFMGGAFPTVGRAVPGPGQGTWLLYHDEDPGDGTRFPAHPVPDPQHLREVLGVVFRGAAQISS